MPLTEQDRVALDYIRKLRANQPYSNWIVPEEHAAKAFEIAEIAKASPAEAVIEAKSYIEGLQKRNAKRQVELQKARQLRRDLIAWEEEHNPQSAAKRTAVKAPRRNLWLTLVGRFVNGGAIDSQVSDAGTRADNAVTAGTVGEPGDTAAKYEAGELQQTKETGARVASQEATRAVNQPVQASAPATVPTRRGCLGLLLFWRSKESTTATASAADKLPSYGFTLPLTNAGPRGLSGVVQRWLLTTLNATPTTGLNWMEVTKEGLQIYQPLATVSQRTIKYRQVRDGQVVISVDPPAYLDSFLGFMRQFRRNIDTPWGEIVIYEGGGARVVARAIALSPGSKIKQIRTALELLHLAENEHEGFRRLPQLQDLFIYIDPDRLEEALA
jgi:hypothetical protein